MEDIKIDLNKRRNCVEWEGRARADVLRDLERELYAAGVKTHLSFYREYYSRGGPAEAKGAQWVPWQTGQSWPVCYAVRGSSEGYYCHIDMINQSTNPRGYTTHDREFITFVKCETWQEAYEIATLSAQILDSVI